MHVIARRLLVVALLIGLAVVVTTAAFVVADGDREDTFVLAQGALADPYFLTGDSTGEADSARELYRVSAHRLIPGGGTIYALRRFSAGDLSSIDDEDYEKLTVWTLAAPPTKFTELSLDRSDLVRAIYGRGGSAWPRHGCAGLLKDGVMTITPEADGFRVTLSGRLQPAQTDVRPGSCEERAHRFDFHASPMSFDELTPWLGLAGEHPYDETYR